MTDTATATAGTDWLAWIQVAGGGGSWAREPDRGEAIRRVLRIFKSDWSGLFGLDGAEVVVNVVDVSGHDQVVFGSFGVRVGDRRGPELDRDIEAVHHIYPGKPKPKRKH